MDEAPEDVVIARRLRWLGHVARMQEDHIPKRLLFGWLIKPVSPVSGTGSTRPHYTRFHPTLFYQVPPETFGKVGFKLLRFIEHTCGFIANVSY